MRIQPTAGELPRIGGLRRSPSQKSTPGGRITEGRKRGVYENRNSHVHPLVAAERRGLVATWVARKGDPFLQCTMPRLALKPKPRVLELPNDPSSLNVLERSRKESLRLACPGSNRDWIFKPEANIQVVSGLRTSGLLSRWTRKTA